MRKTNRPVGVSKKQIRKARTLNRKRDKKGTTDVGGSNA
jgi:hypothetical protein